MEIVVIDALGTLRDAGRELRGDPLELLGRAVELEGDFRLRSFFLLLLAYPDLARLNAFLPGLLKKYPGWPDKVPTPLGVDRLRLDRTVEMIGHPPPARLEIYVSLRGFSAEEEVEIKPFPAQMLLDVPLSLGRCAHKLLGDMFGDASFTTVFRLFDFVEAISWQLMFHGSPMECALRR